VILAAGALATPHLLLASNLAAASSAPDAVGHYLLRHRNAVALGLFLQPPNDEPTFDKQVAIHDFYFGHPAIKAPRGKLGGIQQLTPPVGLARAYVPRLLRTPAAIVVSRCSGLLVIAEDQPRHHNAVTIDRRHSDRFGLPRLHIVHRHTPRDELAAAALIAQAKRVLRAAGARFTFVHEIKTFSHALGTVRMGVNPRTAPLDINGRYRGLDNLYVVDGSALPRSAGVNPSLTIAANALRIGAMLAETAPRNPRALRTDAVSPAPALQTSS
jgi:choline dehydrogenase-like flavoprotein